MVSAVPTKRSTVQWFNEILFVAAVPKVPFVQDIFKKICESSALFNDNLRKRFPLNDHRVGCTFGLSAFPATNSLTT
jgi:hypothetical protein